jgi:gas vesicle protein
MKNRRFKTAAGIVSFLMFTAIGIFLGFMFAPSTGHENRKQFFKMVKKLKRDMEMNKGEIKAHVWEVFGEVNDELEKGYIEAREHVSAIADILSKEADLTKAKYDEIVEDTVKRVGKARDWTKKSTQNLINELQEEWEEQWV